MENTVKKTIVIFANSIKHQKHCIAGKIVGTQQWVRPVSDVQGSELSDQQCLCKNKYGEFPTKLLQKIEMTFSQHVPLINQPENHLISNQTWQQRYKIEEKDILDYLDTPEDLWGSGDSVNYAQIENKTIKINQSLYLVKLEDLQLSKTSDNKRRAIFKYRGINYDLAVTDPNFKNYKVEEKQYHILCISLGEKFHGYCYKIVAAIL